MSLAVIHHTFGTYGFIIRCVINNKGCGLVIIQRDDPQRGLDFSWTIQAQKLKTYHFSNTIQSADMLLQFLEEGWNIFRDYRIWSMASKALWVCLSAFPDNVNLYYRYRLQHICKHFASPPQRWLVCYLFLGLDCPLPIVGTVMGWLFISRRQVADSIRTEDMELILPS